MDHKRLVKNKDFKIVYSKGKSLATRLLVMYYKKNGLQETRVGFSISKKVGGAVVRNRVRRLMKENLKNAKIPIGYDIIFIARIPCKEARFQEIGKSISYLFRKSGV